LTIQVFNFSRSNGAWYRKSVWKEKVAPHRGAFVEKISDL